MDEAKMKLYKDVIKGTALLLFLSFFFLPLVQCSQDSSLTASGWEIAIGTGLGNLYAEASGESGNSLAFALIVIPFVLLVFALANEPFAVLRNTSVVGLLIKVAFIIAAYVQMNSEDYRGYFTLTMFNWLVLAIYVGICVLTNYCRKFE